MVHITQCIRKASSNLKVLLNQRNYLLFTLENVMSLLFFSILIFAISRVVLILIRMSLEHLLKIYTRQKKYQRISHTLETIKWLNMYRRRLLHVFIYLIR